LTEVHASPEGDIFLPAFPAERWGETDRIDHGAEGVFPAYSFVTLDRR
jgi:dihydrofolate reductase